MIKLENLTTPPTIGRLAVGCHALFDIKIMTHIEYRITCDKCTRKEFSGGYDDEVELRMDANEKGWKKRRVQNGNFWDFCPKCSKLEDEKSILSNK